MLTYPAFFERQESTKLTIYPSRSADVDSIFLQLRRLFHRRTNSLEQPGGRILRSFIHMPPLSHFNRAASKTNVRQRLACDRCHSQKLRCIKRPGSHVCHRCISAGTQCVFGPCMRSLRGRHIGASSSSTSQEVAAVSAINNSFASAIVAWDTLPLLEHNSMDFLDSSSEGLALNESVNSNGPEQCLTLFDTDFDVCYAGVPPTAPDPPRQCVQTLKKSEVALIELRQS